MLLSLSVPNEIGYLCKQKELSYKNLSWLEDGYPTVYNH